MQYISFDGKDHTFMRTDPIRHFIKMQYISLADK